MTNSSKSVQPLLSVGAQTLMETVLPQTVWLVEGLLPTASTNLLCSPPKFGKSILCMELGHAVAMGIPFLGRPTVRAGVAYLCLEDKPQRLQERLWKMTDESSDRFRLIMQSETLAGGLIEQMKDYLVAYPDTKLFILDTLQVIRGNTADYSYAADYADLRRFKRFADENDVCLVIVHHLRKMESASDEFADIAGTVGISGAVDGMLVMKKADRASRDCRLMVTGRDVEYAEMKLHRDGMRWKFVEQLNEEEAIEERVPDAVKETARFVEFYGAWDGKTSELTEELAMDGVRPATLGKQLSQFRSWLLSQGVVYESKHTREGTVVRMWSIDSFPDGLPETS